MRFRKPRLPLLLLIGIPILTGVLLLLLHIRTPKISDPKCRAAYENLYRKDPVDIRIVFGYKDARPARLVGDRYESAHFIHRLIDSGFERSLLEEALFTKRIRGLNGKHRTLQVRVLDSSAGPDDVENRKDPFQEWKSKAAEKFFEEGLKQADVVFYDGHSRDGGGPDFEPPHIRDGGHVDYGWYQQNKPGFTKMLSALKKGSPKLVGLFSCVSDRHFSAGILGANRLTGLIASEALIYYADSLEAMLESLTGLAEMKCQHDFHPAGTHILRFFDRP